MWIFNRLWTFVKAFSCFQLSIHHFFSSIHSLLSNLHSCFRKTYNSLNSINNQQCPQLIQHPSQVTSTAPTAYLEIMASPTDYLATPSSYLENPTASLTAFSAYSASLQLIEPYPQRTQHPSKLPQKHPLLTTSPPSTQIRRNWFCLSRLPTMVAIGFQKSYGKSVRHESCDVWCLLIPYHDVYGIKIPGIHIQYQNNAQWQ